MILFHKITHEILSREGKRYKWPPCNCQSCQRPMWGHGYVARFFSCFAQQLFLKRYRCPTCGTVATSRPDGYWAFIRSSINQIYQALKTRLTSGRWPPDQPRQRCGHWIRRFIVHAKMSCQHDLPTFLDHCLNKNLRFFP
jgi:hypothetical protein